MELDKEGLLQRVEKFRKLHNELTTAKWEYAAQKQVSQNGLLWKDERSVKKAINKFDGEEMMRLIYDLEAAYLEAATPPVIKGEVPEREYFGIQGGKKGEMLPSGNVHNDDKSQCQSMTAAPKEGQLLVDLLIMCKEGMTEEKTAMDKYNCLFQIHNKIWNALELPKPPEQDHD